MISIIITAYKEEKTISKAIQAFLDNPLRIDYELLVFAPDEPTLKKVREFAKKNKKIRPIKDTGKGKPAALNLAFQKSKGEILVLSDGDVFVDKNSLVSLLKPFFEYSNVGAVTGRPISINSEKEMLGYWGKVLFNIAHERRLTAIKRKERIFCSGYLYAFRKSLIKKIPENLLSEDGYISHLIYEKKYKISYAPEARVYVKYPQNFKDWIIQKKRGIGGYNQIRKMIGANMRSFSQESSGAFQFLKYIHSLRQFNWTLLLFFARLYLWILIFLDINIKQKSFNEVWLRVESTK